MKAYVVGFIFTEEKQEVLLVQKKVPEWQAGKWNGVGGHVEIGELPREAIKREVKEEVGLNTMLKEWEHVITFVCPGGTIFFFRYPKLYGFDKTCLPEENDVGEKLGWFSVDELPSDILTNLRWIVPFCFYQELQHPAYVQEHMESYRYKDS